MLSLPERSRSSPEHSFSTISQNSFTKPGCCLQPDSESYLARYFTGEAAGRNAAGRGGVWASAQSQSPHDRPPPAIYGFRNSANDADTIALASPGVRSCPRDDAEAIATCAATVSSAAVCRSIARRTLASILVRTALSAGAVSCFSSFELAILFSLIDINDSHARAGLQRRRQHTNAPVDSASWWWTLRNLTPNPFPRGKGNNRTGVEILLEPNKS